MLAGVVLTGLALPVVAYGTVGAASKTRTSGTGESVDVSWTEYDPNDLLGLPGNVHVGYLSAYSGPYGTYINGSVSDFDCDEGETPFGGHHGGVEVVVDEAIKTATTAKEDAIDSAIDSGAASIDADAVINAMQEDLSTEVPEQIVEEVGVCDYIQDRFLSGDGTATFSADTKTKVATITGTLTVSNGGHGEPGNVLGNPPVNITITGGDWNKYESTYKTEGAGYKYSDWNKGTSYYGGSVTGGIGPMGFADDVDDVSYGGFGSYRFKTVERIR